MRHRYLRDSNDLKSIVRDTVYKVRSLDFDCLHGGCDWGEDCDQRYNCMKLFIQTN